MRKVKRLQGVVLAAFLACRRSAFLVLAAALLGALGGCVHLRSGGSGATIQDIDGNSYPTVVVGGQVWLGANLRTTRTPSGAPLITHFPNNDSSTVPIYGRLYAWDAAQVACPRGWRLPSDGDWTELENFLGRDAGLLIRDPALWPPPTVPAGLPVPLAVRPAGYHSDGEFDSLFGARAVFWSATPQDEHLVWSRVVVNGTPPLRRATQHPQYGFSVCCIMASDASRPDSKSALRDD